MVWAIAVTIVPLALILTTRARTHFSTGRYKIITTSLIAAFDTVFYSRRHFERSAIDALQSRGQFIVDLIQFEPKFRWIVVMRYDDFRLNNLLTIFFTIQLTKNHLFYLRNIFTFFSIHIKISDTDFTADAAKSTFFFVSK